MKIKKKVLLGAGVFLITLLMILSSGVSIANTIEKKIEEPTSVMDTADMEYPVNANYKNIESKSIGTKRMTCYGNNLHNDPNDNLVWFYSDIPSSFTHIADASSVNFLSGGCFVGPYGSHSWWACEYSPDASNIWEIDETTGAMYMVGNSGIGLNGLAYDPAGDIIYGCNGTALFIIDKSNGDASYIGPFDTGGLMIGIACDMNGNMYGEDLGTDSLYEINTLTGEATLIGPLGINLNYAQDIGYDKDNDILYSTGYKGSTNGGGAFGTLDLSTGVFTKIDDFPIGDMDCPSEVACLGIPYGVPNDPPEAPIIDGPLAGEKGVELCWTFHSDDPNGDELMYIINWDDGTNDTTDCYPACTPVEVCHTYAKNKKYVIVAKAKECSPDGLESDESTYEVTIPRNRAIHYTLLLRLFERFPNAFFILRALL
jgi:hypothetical protein